MITRLSIEERDEETHIDPRIQDPSVGVHRNCQKRNSLSTPKNHHAPKTHATLCHTSRVQVGLGCEAVAEGLRCHVAKGSGGRPSSRAQHRGAEIHQVDLGLGPRRELRGDVGKPHGRSSSHTGKEKYG